MKHLLNRIASMRWAMTRDAMDAVWQIASRELTAADYEIFHRVSLDKRKALVADIGEPFGESKTAFVNGDTGVLLFDGPIIPRADSFSAMSGMISLDTMTADLKAFAEDPSIKQIVGLFDTPGGDVTGVSEFSDLVRSMSKPTVGFAYGSASSAGYWILSGFKRRVASKTATVGSIGVVAKFRVNKDDNSVEIVSAQSPDKRPDIESKEGRASIQVVVDELADVFVSDVARNMGVKKQKVLSDFGKGGEVVAGSALSAGMIDEISTLDTLMSSFNNSTEPAHSGGTGGGVTMSKTLEEILAENPAAKAEYDALHPAEPQEQRVEPTHTAPPQPANADMSLQETIAAAKPFLTADYPDTTKKLAADVIAGDAPLVALTASVASVDAIREEIASKAAVEDSEKIGGTKKPKGDNHADGYVGLAQTLRVAQGLEPRKMGVN
jgi:ClpP class serine protease